MNIRKNKTLFHDNVKRFALKATASAILALNAKTVMATSCPAYIADTILEQEVCEFNATSSVTVANDGVVGGIGLLAVDPPPTPPLYIAINAGGVINNMTGTGINISNSSLSNGISNSGTINTQSMGISISNVSEISGGLSNRGVINSINGTGILIDLSTINGGISNSGKIEAGGDLTGIAMINGATIEGDVTNSGLIAAGSGNGILLRTDSVINGSIVNSGAIRSAENTGIAVFNELTIIQGNISNSGVISGGLQGVSIHNLGGVDGSISNTGTISGGRTGISVFSHAIIGSITNSGTISGGRSGIAIHDAATVTGGISNSGIIQGNINAISIAGSTVANIDVLGQDARIIGSVDAPDTNVNITNGALFTSEGSYHVRTFNISSNALFNMANMITAQNVNNSGTLAITNTLQTMVGNYTQQTGGLFQTDVSNVSDYGQLLVTEAVDLSQSGDIYVQVGEDVLLHNGDVLSDVISGNMLILPANGLTVSDNSYIWVFAPTLNSTNNGVNLTATINPEAYNACKGTYCQGAATAILGQVAAGNPVFSPYATLATANVLRDAASQATPELINENIQVVQLITRSVMDIAPMWNTLRGKSSGDAMLYQPGKIWMKPYGASMTQNERTTVPGFNATAYGAVIGKDIQLTNDWLFGGGFAAGGDKMHGKSILSGQSINSQAYQGLLYGAKTFPNHVYFAGQGLLGYETNDTRRAIPLYASTAKGSYNNWFTNFRAEAGWSTYALSPKFVFTPTVDASYLFINQNGYKESGSPMSLLVASNHNSSLVLGAYGNGAYHLPNIHNETNLTLTGYAGLAGDVLNNQPQVTSIFVASGSTFSTFGVQFNRIVFRGGAGLTLTNPTSPLLIELNYDVQTGNNAYSGIGSATIKYKI